MEKLDRLGWVDGLSFTAYGTRIGVRTNRPEMLEQVEQHLPPGWKPAPSPIVERLYSLKVGGAESKTGSRRFHLLYAGLTRLARSMELDEVFDNFASDLQLYVAEYARRRVFVHAGVVGWRGQAILIPGRSFSGKTTLVAEVVRAGANYYSDEYAVLDAQGRVHPYARPLEIREQPAGKQKKYPVEVLGGQSGRQPLPVGTVVITQFKEKARWRPQSISSGQGILALLANTVSARRQPEAALAALKQVASRARLLKGVRGEAGEVTAALPEGVGN